MMRYLRIFLRTTLALLGLGLVVVAILYFKFFVLAERPLEELERSSLVPNAELRRLRDIYNRGGGMDDDVAAYVRRRIERYISPAIDLLATALPGSEEEKTAMFFAERFSEDCRMQTALLNRVLLSNNHLTRLKASSRLHRTYDEIEITPNTNTRVSASLIRFHDDPTIEEPPSAWRRFGATQYQGFFDEDDSHVEAVRFAASQLSSIDRRSLMYWLESISDSGTTNDKIVRALSELGRDYYTPTDDPTGADRLDYVRELNKWITQAELKVTSIDCQGVVKPGN